MYTQEMFIASPATTFPPRGVMTTMPSIVGPGVGDGVGPAVGSLDMVGGRVGLGVGSSDGLAVGGDVVGIADGAGVGISEGRAVGKPDGVEDGAAVGDAVGAPVFDSAKCSEKAWILFPKSTMKRRKLGPVGSFADTFQEKDALRLGEKSSTRTSRNDEPEYK